MKGRDARHITRDALTVIREIILKWFVEQSDTLRKESIRIAISNLEPAFYRKQNLRPGGQKNLISHLQPNL